MNKPRLGVTARVVAVVAALSLSLTACSDGSGSSGEGGGDLDTSFLTIATGGTSGVYYQVGATFGKILEEELGSDTTVQSTGASAENINLLNDGNAEIAFTMGDANVQAMEGTGPFEGDKREGLLAMAALYPNTAQIVATKASGITSVEDLKGKRVSVGDVGSGVELNAQLLLKAHDMSYDDLKVDYLPYSEAVEQMANGQTDAAFVTSGVPNPSLTELATNTEFIILPIEGEAKEKLLTENDFFVEDEIPGGTYMQDEAVETVGVTNHILLHPDLSEQAAYDITKAFFDNLDQIHASHAAAKKITLEKATTGLTVPLHPGAKRYYEENGVEVPQ